MAPMEGLTDFTYRNAYEKTFGKGRITKYFTPFISPNKSENFLAREIRDIDRGHNKDTYTVVQVMTNEAKDFIWTAKMLYENTATVRLILMPAVLQARLFQRIKAQECFVTQKSLTVFLMRCLRMHL